MIGWLLAATASAAPTGCGGFDGWVGRYDWCVDSALAGGLALGAGLTTQLMPPVSRRVLFDSRSDDAAPRLSARAASASDWLSPGGIRYGTGVPFTVGAIAASAAVGGALGDRSGPRVEGAIAGSLASLEAIGLSLSVSQALQAATGRPRPYTSEAFEEVFPDWSEPLRANDAAYRSWPDGHTAATAAALTTPATLWALAELRRGPPSWRLLGPAAAAGLAIGGASGVGYLRVRSGLHHRDDTYVGALLGATAGVAVPLLHGLGPAAGQVRVGGDGTVGLAGRW